MLTFREMARGQVWVSPKENGGWRIHKSGSSRDSAHLDIKSDAIDRAREIARNHKSELKIQNRDGRISQSNSYGRDPFPPRDRR